MRCIQESKEYIKMWNINSECETETNPLNSKRWGATNWLSSFIPVLHHYNTVDHN